MSALPNDIARFLFLVPHVASRPEGVPIAELCDYLALTPAKLRRLVEKVCLVGTPDGTADELVDLYFKRDRLFVHLPQKFTRMPRFSVEEMLALIVALAPLRHAPLPSLQEAAAQLIARLQGLGNQRAGELSERLVDRVQIHTTSREDPAHLALLEEAVQTERCIDAEYYTASRDALGARVLQPHALLQVRGMWYVIDGEGKVFKVERFRHISLREDDYFARSSPDIEAIRSRLEARKQMPTTQSDGVEALQTPVVVHVGERVEHHPSADPALHAWVRSTLGEAVIASPPAAREAMIQETLALLRRYE